MRQDRIIIERLDALTRLGFGFALVLLGTSSVHQSVGAPLPQEIALCGLGAISLLGGGAYVMKWLWKQ